MKKSAFKTQNTGVRSRYIHVGIDDEGASHVYCTASEDVLVIGDGEISYVHDVTGRTVNNYIDYVATRRGWAKRDLKKNFAETVTVRVSAA